MMAWVSLVHCGTYLPARLSAHLQSELEISLAEQDLLKQLGKQGGLRMSEVAERIFLSRAGMTKMVDRLEVSGLVQRAPVDGDRRSIGLHLTQEGQRVLKRSQRALKKWIAAEFRDRMSDSEVRALGGALASLLEGHGRWQGQRRHLASED